MSNKGYRRMTGYLCQLLQGSRLGYYNLKQIRRLMKNFNFVCPHRKPNPYKRIAKATQEYRILPNRLL